jgi:hypothetical protein
MTDPPQLSEVGGGYTGYVDDKMVCFHSLKRDRKKEISLINYM